MDRLEFNFIHFFKVKKDCDSLSEALTDVQKNGDVKFRHKILPNPLVFYRVDLPWTVSQNKKTECNS
jgi:hypothetical protein